MLKSKICADLKSKICVDLIVKSSFIDSVKRARIWQKNGLFIEGTKEGIKELKRELSPTPENYNWTVKIFLSLDSN